jgi:cation transport protein ChaC
MVYRVAAGEASKTIAYLRQREQVTGVYREARLPVLLLKHDGAHHEVLALTYVAERAHPQYAGRLPVSAQARIVSGARGVSGINLAYLARTVRHLTASGVRDEGLERVLRLAGLKGRSAERWEAMSAIQARRALADDARRGIALLPRVDRANGARFQYRRNLGRWD